MLKEMNPEDGAAVAKQTAQIPTKRRIDDPSPHLCGVANMQPLFEAHDQPLVENLSGRVGLGRS